MTKNADTVKPIHIPPTYCEYCAGPCDQKFENAHQLNGMFLYPSQPQHIAEVIESAASHLKDQEKTTNWHTWRDLKTVGQIIYCTICKGMRFSDVLVMDVTTLNFNLLFEIGFALGLGVPVIPIRDTSITSDTDIFRELGILDTIGYLDFQNSDALINGIQERLPVSPMPKVVVDLNRENPLYVVKGPHLTEGDVRVLSELKKSAVRFRTFDVAETPRLSLHEARRQVESSLAFVAHLLDPKRMGAKAHNARCAVLAGIAMATGKTVFLLQEVEFLQPIDYRDIVFSYRSLDHIPRLLEGFLRKVIVRLQDLSSLGRPVPTKLLEKINLGDVAAENEIIGLRSYFIRTAPFTEAKRGLARLVTGRKGSGKTAIFYGVRDSIPRTPNHLVLDLKPEGHQFIKLREAILDKLSPGLQEHTLVAFWNYILLCEIAQKIRDNDYSWAQRDPVRQPLFDRILDVYGRQVSSDAGDFSERLLRQVDCLAGRFVVNKNHPKLTGGQITETLFSNDIRDLDEALAPYLEQKVAVWILIDNLDKGWPTKGAVISDILILRSLLSASRKLQRQLENRDVQFHALVFLRNDIHEYLIKNTSDRGKDTAIVVDWNDIELFKQLLAQRIIATTGIEGTFEELWRLLFDPYVGTQDSFRWVVKRTLMRPRDLLNFVNGAIGVAINRGHDRVLEDDLLKAEETYSEDLLFATAWELQDVYPDMIDVLYHFDRKAAVLSMEDARACVESALTGKDSPNDMVELLAWFGFFGVVEDASPEPTFSYMIRYNLRKLLTPVRRGIGHLYIHPAFWHALSIHENQGH